MKYISSECYYFLDYAFFGHVNYTLYKDKLGNLDYDRNVSYYYLYKLLVDTSKSNNDIVVYENCLYNPPSFKGLGPTTLGYIDNTPTFVISVIDLINSNSPKNNILLLKLRDLFGVCFPQGKNSDLNHFNKTGNSSQYYHKHLTKY